MPPSCFRHACYSAGKPSTRPERDIILFVRLPAPYVDQTLSMQTTPGFASHNDSIAGRTWQCHLLPISFRTLIPLRTDAAWAPTHPLTTDSPVYPRLEIFIVGYRCIL